MSKNNYNSNNDTDLDVNIQMGDDNKKNIKNSSQKQSPENDGQPKEKVDFTNFLQHANNPIVVFFTLLFKVGAAVM